MASKFTVDENGKVLGTLARVQRESHEWRQAAYPTTSTPELQALGMNEEGGEVVRALLESIGMVEKMGNVSHAVLKYVQGIRGYDKEKTQLEVGDGLADMMIYMCGIASALDLDLEEELLKAWIHVRDRNITEGSMGHGNVDA